jgi:hypothetical protein
MTEKGIVDLAAIPSTAKGIKVTATRHDFLPTQIVVDASDITTTGLVRRVARAGAPRAVQVQVQGTTVRVAFTGSASAQEAWLCGISGRQVDRMRARQADWTIRGLSRGVYVLNVRQDGTVRSSRVVVR